MSIIKRNWGKPAKAYEILGVKMYLYRRVLDEIQFPVIEKKRYNFSTGVGTFSVDKLVLDEEEQLKNILGDDYRKKHKGYMFVSESVKQQLEEKYKRKGA